MTEGTENQGRESRNKEEETIATTRNYPTQFRFEASNNKTEDETKGKEARKKEEGKETREKKKRRRTNNPSQTPIEDEKRSKRGLTRAWNYIHIH
jgi:hypothetical protein